MHGIWFVSYILAWLLVITLSLVTISLFWVIGKIHLRDAPETSVLITDDGPQLHQDMPRFEIRDYIGNLLRVEDYIGRQWVLLLLSVGCEPCEELLHHMQSVRRRMDTKIDFVIVLDVDPHIVANTVERYKLSMPVVSDEGSRFRDSLGISRIPYGFAIDEMGKVQMKGVVNTGEQLEGLILHQGRPMTGTQRWETEPSSAS